MFPSVPGKSRIGRNRKLLDGLFAAAAPLLSDRGRVHVTLVKGQGGTAGDERRVWGNHWQLERSAAEAGLVLARVEPFEAADFAIGTDLDYAPVGRCRLSRVCARARPVNATESPIPSHPFFLSIPSRAPVSG